jgi:hypothetical protein
LLVAEEKPVDGALWRWTFAAPEGQGWERLATTPNASAVGVAASGVLVGFDDGHLVTLAGGREVHRVELGETIQYIVPTRDRRWVAVQLQSGRTALLDGTTGDIIRTLSAADSNGMSPTFDEPGDLLLRPIRGGVTVWDRATGDQIVADLDLLKPVNEGIVFGPDDTLEIQGPVTATIDIRRDTRPTAAILADIACHVPFKIVDGRLEPAAPHCSPAP